MFYNETLTYWYYSKTIKICQVSLENGSAVDFRFSAVEPLRTLCIIWNMANREKIAVGEYYHIYNRGVDKRAIIQDTADADRFLISLKLFNTKMPVGSLREVKDETQKPEKSLVEIVCYVLHQNHFHLLLKEITEGGISECMKRISGGYTWYFNNKYKRSGSLFQGRFKSVHIETNEQLLHVSAYINLNDEAHRISGSTAVKGESSWTEYQGERGRDICTKEVILEQFKTTKDYIDFAESSIKEILRVKEDKNNVEMLIGKYLF